MGYKIFHKPRGCLKEIITASSLPFHSFALGKAFVLHRRHLYKKCVWAPINQPLHTERTSRKSRPRGISYKGQLLVDWTDLLSQLDPVFVLLEVLVSRWNEPEDFPTL